MGAVGAHRAVLWVEQEKAVPGETLLPQWRLRKELFALAAEHEQAQCIELISFHPAFPVDIRHNAKIGREQLAYKARKMSL